MNHFESPNSYCAEIEATIQTLRMTIELGLDEVVFKGDDLNVIMSLKGLEQLKNWQAKSKLIEGRRLLQKFMPPKH